MFKCTVKEFRTNLVFFKDKLISKDWLQRRKKCVKKYILKLMNFLFFHILKQNLLIVKNEYKVENKMSCGRTLTELKLKSKSKT